jgi:hypothetical protein
LTASQEVTPRTAEQLPDEILLGEDSLASDKT